MIVRNKRDAEGVVSFDLAWIGGSEREPNEVVRRYQMTPELVRTLSKAYDPIFEFYWATPRTDRSAINASA